MLETVLKLYIMAMAADVRSPTPHLFGPPGCGKSSVVEEAAKLLGVNLHIINVSRISPLELEGVQMPDKNHIELKLLTATHWTQLKHGDIVLLDEFLRGFPEVYNGLLDIMTARQVAGFQLPRVFFIAASNSTATYDKALEDRLLHIPVPDPRKLRGERKRLAAMLTERLGLMPEMANSYEMDNVVDTEILPTYAMLDALKGTAVSASAATKGCSIRNLIGQAQLRHVSSTALAELIQMNNTRAISAGKPQFVLLLTGKNADPHYEQSAITLRGNPKLTPIQALNLEMNLQLLGLEQAKKEKEVVPDDDDIFA